MKRGKGFGLILGILILLSVVLVLIFRRTFQEETYDYKVKVAKWDNVYEGNNIQFYYMDKDNANLVALKNKYGLEKVVSGASNDLEKSIAMIKWLNKRAEVKASAMEAKKTVDELLIALETNKVISLKDYNVILEEALTSIGVICRTGEFRTNDVKYKEENNYNVLEVWSREHGKWVMIDGGVEGFLVRDSIPLAAIEIIKAKEVKLTSENITQPEKYQERISKYLDSYTIKINNNKFEQGKSNSYITFISNDKDIQLETFKGYIQPTIFVKNQELFGINPEILYHNDESDIKPTMILAKRNIKDDTNEYIKFTLGAFMNSYMIDTYFITINNGEYIPVNRYYDLSLPTGKTTIGLSLDGKTKIGSIELEKR